MSKHFETQVVSEENRFMITEDRAWFLSFEDKATAPAFGEILVQVLRNALADEEVLGTKLLGAVKMGIQTEVWG